MESVEPDHVDKHHGPWRAVAMVLAEVQAHSAARHLHVERRMGLETVLPVDREAEEINVELARLLNREDAEHRDDALDVHDLRQRVQTT